MNYEPRDIRQIKLVTGDELLTEVVGEDKTEVLIRNPLKVHKERYVIKGTPKEANFFTRWMGFAENQEFIIHKSHIITEAIVDDGVADHYNGMMYHMEQHDEEVSVATEVAASDDSVTVSIWDDEEEDAERTIH